jgi:GNAT superfamily N-acetyltransferase
VLRVDADRRRDRRRVDDVQPLPAVDLAVAVDAASLADAVALLGEQFAEHEIALTKEALDVAVRAMVDDDTRGALILARTTSPVGVAVIAYTWTLEHGGLVAWLDELYVVPSARSRGVGTALLHHAIEVAKSAGALAIELEVETSHARAERLYAREGFTRLQRARWSLGLSKRPA